MKALVTFCSQTGNTEKLAEAIYEGIEQAEKDILPIKDAGDTEGYDVIFCGFPVQAHSVPEEMASFIKNIPDGKKLAIFATHGSLRGGELAITAFYDALRLTPKGTVLGTFGCRGTVKSGIIDSLINKPEHRGWALEAQGAIGHPDAADLGDAKEWAGAMVSKARAQ